MVQYYYVWVYIADIMWPEWPQCQECLSLENLPHSLWSVQNMRWLGKGGRERESESDIGVEDILHPYKNEVHGETDQDAPPSWIGHLHSSPLLYNRHSKLWGNYLLKAAPSWWQSYVQLNHHHKKHTVLPTQCHVVSTCERSGSAIYVMTSWDLSKTRKCTTLWGWAWASW